MRMPRFTIRTVLISIILVALVLGIAAVTRENARLRRELAETRALQAASLVLSPLYDTVDLDEVLTTAADLSVYRAAARATGMPNGSAAFSGTTEQPEAKP